VVEHLSSSLRRELDFRKEAENIDRMREVLAPYSRLQVPHVYHDLSTPRLLVMEEVQGGPLREAPESEARREAARQLLEAYYRQVLHAGFFHADPHPGNLLWWKGSIYFLDLGMVGEVAPEVRELMAVLLVAFFRQDAAFLTEALLMLSGAHQPPDLDLEALEGEFSTFIQQYGGLTALRDIRIGPMLEGLASIAARHGMRLPATLALAGKAFGQMQLVAAELDPKLAPGEVINAFLVRSLRDRVRAKADPHGLFYEGQKLKLRFTRILEAVERAAGSRPGPRLQIEFLGASAIEDEIRRTGRRIALAGFAGAMVASAMAGWVASRAARSR
jgi:ubiquinone biosynthesis protein